VANDALRPIFFRALLRSLTDLASRWAEAPDAASKHRFFAWYDWFCAQCATHKAVALATSIAEQKDALRAIEERLKCEGALCGRLASLVENSLKGRNEEELEALLAILPA